MTAYEAYLVAVINRFFFQITVMRFQTSLIYA